MPNNMYKLHGELWIILSITVFLVPWGSCGSTAPQSETGIFESPITSIDLGANCSLQTAEEAQSNKYLFGGLSEGVKTR